MVPPPYMDQFVHQDGLQRIGRFKQFGRNNDDGTPSAESHGHAPWRSVPQLNRPPDPALAGKFEQEAPYRPSGDFHRLAPIARPFALPAEGAAVGAVQPEDPHLEVRASAT